MQPRVALRSSPEPVESTTNHLAASSGRDAAVDIYRAAAVVVVVIGHWLIAVVHWQGGKLHAVNLLDAVPATQWATWLLQPMPLFFVVGGWAAMHSWTASSNGGSATKWVSGRLTRLLVPTTTYATVALALAVLLGLAIGDTADPAGRLLGMHLWFLAVFIPATALAPWLARRVQHHGWRVPTLLGAATIAVDLLRFVVGVPGIGWVNFAFVWLLFMAIGMATHRYPPRRADTIMVGVLSFTLLVTVVALDWYPHSMVGVGNRSNNTPPTVALALLGIAQAAVAALGAPWLRRRHANGRRLRHATMLLGGAGMHLYLWHLIATLALVGLIGASGVGNIAPLGVTWWASRPVWLMLLAVVTVPIVAAAVSVDRGRFERSTESRPPSPVAVICSVAVAVAALTAISLLGFGSGFPALGAVVGLWLAVRLARGPLLST